MIRPTRSTSVERKYIVGTNVLETSFLTGKARITVVDFMPINGDIRGKNSAETPPAIMRLVKCAGEADEIEILWEPRLAYAAEPTVLDRSGHLFRARKASDSAGGGDNLWFWCSQRSRLEWCRDHSGESLRGHIRLEPGRSVALVTYWGRGFLRRLERVEQYLESTIRSWRAWLQAGRDSEKAWRVEHARLLDRTELALKLLIHQKTGAIAAAATTSLPEAIGGERNWDYRYAWVRDSAMTAQALTAIGHIEEARDYLYWMESLAGKAEKEQGFHLLYGLRGETQACERVLDHLEGYRGSRPVRVGNGAANQVQHDIFGEFIDAAYELRRNGSSGTISDRFLVDLANRACASWRAPDHGIWESRAGKRQYVYSKLMAWVALDRALLLSRFYGLRGPIEKWYETRQSLRELILRRGFSAERGAFVRTFSSRDLDASLLHIGLQEFLPMDDPRVQGTIDAIIRELSHDGLVRRYARDDGLSGAEGAFVLCSFWLCDALALSGRIDEGEGVFEAVVSRMNPLGLLSEEMDIQTGEYLGNYPQAFSHIGLINSLVTLNHVKGRRTEIEAPIGSREHRDRVQRGRYDWAGWFASAKS